MGYSIEHMKADRHTLEQEINKLVNAFSAKYSPDMVALDLESVRYLGGATQYIARITVVI